MQVPTQMKTSLIRSIALAAVAVMPVMAEASDWPQFRGRDAGVAPDNSRLPAVWDTTKNVVWATEIPGIGWSSPIVSGDHVIVTAVVGGEADPSQSPAWTTAAR